MTSAGGSQTTCGPFGEDSSYFIPNGTVIPAGGIPLPYNAGSGGLTLPAGPLAAPGGGVTLVGLRPFSSPLCQPLTGAGCPSDGTPVFSGIFTENTVARSNYNSLQVLLQKNFTKGLQFQASYTFSKTMDNASSFESALNPLNFNATYGLSAYDARNRFVFNYVWDLPVPKFDGFKGKVLDGWELTGIVTFQSGFPIRITSASDVEELDSTDLFEFPGEPNLTAPFHTQDIRKNNGFVFDPALFHQCNRGAGNHRRCAALHLLRTRHQQLGHEFHERNAFRRTMEYGVPRRHLQRLESRAVLQRGWQRVERRQHLWTSSTCS